MIKFAYTILYVSDVQKSVQFYQDAFDFQKKFITPEGDYGEIISGSTTIAFASHELAHSNLKEGYTPVSKTAKPFGIELGFTTDHVEALVLKVIKAGGTEVEPAITKPWGQIVAYVRDLEGFLLELCTEIKN